jgi:hypothetical protein
VVVVSADEYERLSKERTPDFKKFLLSGPDFSVLELDTFRREMPRDVDL